MKNKMLGLLVLIFCSGVYGNSPGWYGPYSVEMIEVDEDRVYFYKPSDIPAFPDIGCNTDYVFLEGGNLQKGAISIGLTAQASGK